MPNPTPEPHPAQKQAAEQPSAEPSTVKPSVTVPTDESSAEHDWGAAEHGDEDARNWPDMWKSDGWAQWVMAATGIVATVISAWAVFLLLATLKATRAAVSAADEANDAAMEAVKVTREVGIAQIRAYLGIATVRFAIDESGKKIFQVKIFNSGQSPAINPMMYHDVDYRHKTITSRVLSGSASLPDLPSGQTITRNLPFVDQRFSGGGFMGATITLKYKTVFGDEELQLQVNAGGQIDRTLPSPGQSINLHCSSASRPDIYGEDK